MSGLGQNEESIELFRRIGDPVGLTSALVNIGSEQLEKGDYVHARLSAVTLFTLGLVERSLGKEGASDKLFSEAIELNREVRYKPGEAMNVLQSGYNELLKGRIPVARSFMEEGLKIYQEIHSE